MSYQRPSGPPPQQQPYQAQHAPQYQSSPDLEQGNYSGYDQNDQKLSPSEKVSQGYSYDRPSEPIPNQPTFEESFKIEKPTWNDWPFTILFLATVAGFICVAAISLKDYANSYSYQGSSIYNNTNSFSLNTNTTILFIFVIVLALVLAAVILGIARMWPRQFITIGIICNVVLGLGTSIMYLCLGYYSAGIVFLVFTVLSAYCYWTCRSRIPFSATVLTIVIDVMKSYPSTYIVSFLGFICIGAFSCLFSVTVTASYMKWGDETTGSHNNAKLVGLLVFIFFAGYYITEVLRNVIHVTVSGIYGTWYYLSKSDGGVPKNQAWGAFKRAMTYCFGSICFGSLLVTIIQLIKQFIQIARQNALGSGQTCEACLLMCVECIMYLIEWLLRYFNRYAFSYIALYGKSYIASAKDTHYILSYKGIDALVNDCLIGTALGLYSLFTGLFTAFLSYMYLRFTKPGYNDSGNYYAPVVAFSFLIGLQICNVVTTTISSGVATFFIALAKDPDVFQASYPERFNEVFVNYPDVLRKIQT